MEPICPLTQKPCMREGCAWYVPSVQQCAVIAIGMVTEKIHDMGADAYKVYVAQPNYDEEGAEGEQNY